MDLDFSLVLCVVLIVSGVAKVVELTVLNRHRDRRKPDASGTTIRREAASALNGMASATRFLSGLFSVVLLVFIVRSFVVEPYRIPSESMLPTLESGDFILVNKFAYGLRLPLLGTKLWSWGVPERGDVFVFRYPQNPSVHYVKRIVGLPGDTVTYKDNQLYINDQKIALEPASSGAGDSPSGLSEQRYRETIGARMNDIYVNPQNTQTYFPTWEFPHRKACHYFAEGLTCRIPDGYYFGMGDNRDNSADSRFWGFVPASNIEGNVFAIWLNVAKPRRIGWID